MNWEVLIKPIKEYRKATSKHRFFRYFHFIIVLVIYELIFNISKTPNAEVYNGSDLWFAVPNWILPGGTLLISLTIIVYCATYVRLDLKGEKDAKERKKDRADKKKAAEKKIFYETPKKKPYKPDWKLFFFINLEGFVWGSIIYMFLPGITFLAMALLFPQEVIPSPIETNESLAAYLTNPFMDFSLAFGSGFYKEAIFRFGIITILLNIKKYTKPIPRFPTIEKVSTIFIIIFSALIYALSHYLLPYSDTFYMYTLIYRFLFGVVMYHIYTKCKLPVAIWTHVFYELWYFILRG
ncbi:MAG: hypothetical protein AAFR66_19870 [Bacteroidota bacterium]